MMNWLTESCSQEVEINDEIIEVVTLQGFECIFKIAFNLVIRLAGIVLFLMLIAGGFKYLTAGGDKEKLQSAQKTITYALAGLILILLGWFILLLIKEFTGVDVTVFEIAGP